MSGEPHIRKVRPDEMEEVWRVHVASSSDGAVRRGQPPTRPADAPVASDARAGLASDPDGYFCAVENGRIRGMVSALVRGPVWYLSMFFVLPGDQGRGLGRALLERALAVPGTSGMQTTDAARIVTRRHSQRASHDCFLAAPRLHPGIIQEVAPNENQRGPKATP